MLELTLRLVFSLAVVIGLLLVLARISSKRFAGRHGAAVQVLHRQALSRSAGVSLVTVGERVLLLGVTDQQVSLIAELDPAELPTLEAAAEEAGAQVHAQVEAHVAAEVETVRVEALTEQPAAAAGVGVVAVATGGRHKSTRPSAVVPTVDGGLGGLNGSVLSPQTWRQAYAAATRRAS